MWIYKNKQFSEVDIPEEAVGFIYLMTAVINGKSVAYIGKKNFFANIKRPLGKKALAMTTDKRLKKYRRELKPDFMKYYSSNKTLKDFAKSGGLIKREMLMICYSKTELTKKILNVSYSLSLGPVSLCFNKTLNLEFPTFS